MLYFASTLPLHADRFDVPHNLLLHCFTLHGHGRGHQDQLLGVGELLNVVHCIYFASSSWSFWCATWLTSTPLHTSWPCPWSPRSTSWGWRTFKCYTLHPLCLFMLIASNVVHCIFYASSCWLPRMLYIASFMPLHADRFDVLHDTLLHSNQLHVHVH